MIMVLDIGIKTTTLELILTHILIVPNCNYLVPLLIIDIHIHIYFSFLHTNIKRIIKPSLSFDHTPHQIIIMILHYQMAL